jgi:flagellar hook-basal body complex protein FliE
MSQFAIDQVLAQMRVMKTQAQGLTPAVEATAGTQKSAATGFASLLQQGLESVNRTQQSAENVATAFERGAPGIELPQVMLEMQKANISFRATVEVRNRLLTAYQDIMNMPISCAVCGARRLARMASRRLAAGQR